MSAHECIIMLYKPLVWDSNDSVMVDVVVVVLYPIVRDTGGNMHKQQCVHATRMTTPHTTV